MSSSPPLSPPLAGRAAAARTAAEEGAGGASQAAPASDLKSLEAQLGKLSNAKILEELKRRGIQGPYRLEMNVASNRPTCIGKILKDMAKKGEGGYHRLLHD
jgi:hypothetical protein